MGRRAPSRDGVKQNLQPSPEKLDIYHKASPEGSEEDLSLCRKLRLCVALLPSEAALVFMQLYMLPVLQALGVPVSMETLSGIFSGSLALATLPMLGWLSDGGSNPNGRKKPAVVASVSVYVVGTLLIVSGCALHMWGGADLTQVTEHQFSVTQHTSIGPSTSSALPTSIDTTRVPVAILDIRSSLESEPLTRPTLSTAPSLSKVTETPASFKRALDSLLSTSANAPDSQSRASTANITDGNLEKVDSISSAGRIASQEAEGRATYSDSVTFSSESATTRSTENILGARSTENPDRLTPTPDAFHNGLSDWMVDPLGVGIPGPGLLAMVGFVFLDAGYDLSNSCVKTFVLAASPQAHHVSLLVLGVLMSAVGGCVTALTGLFDLGSILTQGTSLDPVVAQALLQASFIVTLALVCTLCTLVSGHASSTTPGHVHDIAIPNPSSSGRDIEQSIIASFGTLHTDVQENVIMATTSPYEAFSATPTANPDRQVFLFPENADSAETFLKSAPRAPAPASEPGQSVKLDTMASSPGANKHLMTYLATSQPRDVDGPGDETAETMADEGNDLMVTSFMDTDVLLEKKSKEKKHRKQRPTPVQCRRIDDIMKMATSKMKENGEATTQAFEFTSSSAIRKAESVSRKDSQVAHSDSNSATDSDGETKRLIKNDRSGLCPGGAACHSKRCPELRCCGRLDRNKRNLVLICLASFFMAGSVQSYNLCVTDYVGKVIFSGDPEADPGSQSYAAYQEGLRAGSLGMLFLNSAYILFNLVHRKILNCFGPKTELLVFSTVQVGLLAALRLTDEQYVFYVTSAVYGVFRSMMYTIPFMLANEMCQEEAKSLTGAGKVKVGTTMALVTSMMPLAYVVVCSMAGPLMDATGDPGAPMFYGAACTVMGAAVFVFYQQR